MSFSFNDRVCSEESSFNQNGMLSRCVRLSLRLRRAGLTEDRQGTSLNGFPERSRSVRKGNWGVLVDSLLHSQLLFQAILRSLLSAILRQVREERRVN